MDVAAFPCKVETNPNLVFNAAGRLDVSRDVLNDAISEVRPGNYVDTLTEPDLEWFGPVQQFKVANKECCARRVHLFVVVFRRSLSGLDLVL